MPRSTNAEILDLDGHEVRISHPEKLYFPKAGITKIDLVRYYLAVADGALRHVRGRPLVMRRFVEGIDGEAFYQKRAPAGLPSYVHTARIEFPSGRSADEIVIDSRASLAFLLNLGCIELHSHPVREWDLEHPDELRIDLDPTPGIPFDHVREVAMVVRAVLEEHGLVGWPKTSGSRGMHVYVRIEPRHSFDEVRRAALALAREVERRVPTIATTAWWKEERRGVFLDYNQNAKDRTMASAYSVRPREDARVSTPLRWDEVPGCDPSRYTIATMRKRFAALGDLHEGMDAAVGRIDSLLELAREEERRGLADAPWPPHHEKRAREPKRAPPSKTRRDRPAER